MASNPITVGDSETIVLYGDSITEQNLYAAYIETFLVSRFPEKHLKIYNFGWGGDTAPGGNGRFARDVAPVKPTMVFVNFGMNDGKYCGQTTDIRETYLKGQRDLAATIRKAGAREVLLTTSPADEPTGPNPYNESLARFADEVLAMGRRLKIPVADILHPMLALARKARAADPKFAFCAPPDIIHPDAMGHLLMAYYVLRQVKAPGPMSVAISGRKAKTAGGAKVTNLRVEPGRIELDLALPHIPFYVPPEARAALDLVPLQEELNGLFFTLAGWRKGVGCRLEVDGREVCLLRPEALAKGIDLALYDAATWGEAGRDVWNLAQYRWKKHFEVWRDMGFETRPAMLKLPGRRKMIAAQRAFVAGLSDAMRALAQPRTYHLVLMEGSEIENFSKVEVSPLYPWDPAKDFEKAYPPETDAARVQWQLGTLENGLLDLGRFFGNPTNCVSYLRVALDAEDACRLHLDLGSDDGLTVLHNGRQLLARDVMRGCVIGDDRLDVDLVRGRNVLLFRVTQGGGGYAFGVRAGVHGAAKVRQRL